MPIGLTAMFRLPALLLEFGRVLELYGAFEAAMEVYGRILGNFPNFRGYFDAMYRSAIIGRHLADLMSTPKQREDTLNKCTDINQFLLEALPVTIDSVSECDVLLLLLSFADPLRWGCCHRFSYISCYYTPARWKCRLIRQHGSKH